VKRYTGHELRRTYAMTCLLNGMDLLELHRRLGHADLRTTEVYLHVVRSRRGDERQFAPV
jgi:site-specific recombinase XerD